MKRFFIGGLLALAWLAFAGHAQAQGLNQALVVSSCGSPPITYAPGQEQLPTVDTNGKLCLLGGGGGGGTPGGTNGQIQFNNAGSFGGETAAISTGCQAAGGTIGNTLVGTIFTAEVPRTISAVNGAILASDCGGLVNLTQASNDAPTIAIAGSTGFPLGWFTELCVPVAFSKTITPASGTIGGAATKILNAASASSPQCMRIVSDGAGNYIINAGIVPASSTIVGGSTPTSGITSGNVVGSSANVIVDTGIAYANLPLLNGTNLFTAANTHSGNDVFSAAGAASTPSVLFSGAAFTGGSGTTTVPMVLVAQSGATAGTAYNTSGTVFGINGHTGIANLVDIGLDGTSRFVLAATSGAITMIGNLTSTGANAIFTVGATGQFVFSGRSILTSTGAGATVLGATPAASPVAQSLTAQGGSGADSGGANLTLSTGNGTGAGAIPSLLLRSPIAVLGSGSTAQTLATGLTIKGGTAILSAYTVSTLPASPTTGAQAYVSDAVACTFLATVTGGGSAFCPVIWNGSAWQGG